MDAQGNVNIFVSEGAGVDAIVEELEASGESIPRDAFGHLKLDKVNVGQYFGKQFAQRLGAEKSWSKSLVTSPAGAPARRRPSPNQACATVAVKSALEGIIGVAGHDEDQNGTLRAKFPRIKGHKPFDTKAPWYTQLKSAIGQSVHQTRFTYPTGDRFHTSEIASSSQRTSKWLNSRLLPLARVI